MSLNDECVHVTEFNARSFQRLNFLHNTLRTFLSRCRELLYLHAANTCILLQVYMLSMQISISHRLYKAVVHTKERVSSLL